MSVVRSSKSSGLWRGAALVLGLSSLTPLAFAAPGDSSGVNPPASPDDAASAMHSLQDVCQQLDYGTTGSRRSDGFNEPTAGPEDTLCSLNELMEKTPAVAADAVSADEVISGKTFWSLEAGAWGKQSGTATAGDHITGAEGELSLNIPNGLYSGDKTATVTDSNLTPENIKSGSSVFGVAGSVVESIGDAIAANVLQDKTFSKAGEAGLTGSMPNNGAVTVTPGTTDQSIAAGYHDGSGKVSGDANLTADNIKSGTSVFGVAGSVVESTGDAIAANVLQDKTFSKAGEADLTGSMPNNGAVTVTPSATDQSIAAGYHDGSGKVSGDANLTADNIKSGSSVFGVAGSVVESTGDAIAANVLQDKTFSKAGEADLTGSMPNNGAVTVTPGTTDQSIAAGYHDGSGKVSGDANLTADNIKSGTSVFGVAGNVVESTGDAIAANVLQDKTFSKAGTAGLTGSMPNNGAVTVTPSATDQSIAAGYHDGSGKVSGDANLTADNIKSGTSVFGVTGSVVESTGDVIAANVLQDKTFSKAGTAGLTGSMPNNGAVTVTPGTTDQSIAAGYHDGSGKVSGDANLIADNIKSGTSVFGVAGSVVESTGDAVAANVLSDKTFSKAGTAGLTGSMPNNGAVTVNPGTSDQTIAAGYHDGSGKVTGDANLTAANIKSGTSVFGVAGSVVESTGDAIAANVLQDKTFSKAGTAGLTGSMPNNGAVTVTPSTTDQAIAAGYHDGTGKVTGDANLTAANIKSGTSVFGVAGSVVESSGDAVAANVLSDKTFSKAGIAGLTGSMPNNGSVTVTPGATDQSIAAGYHDGTGKVTGDANLTADNIKSGTSVFGVAGSVVESTGDAVAANVLSDKTFSKAGTAGLTGSMPNNGAVTVTPGTSDQAIATGYHDGSGKVAGDANLTADNIKSGSSVFGVAGSVVESTGDAVAANVLSDKTFSKAGEAGLTGSMPNNGAVTVTPGTSDQAIAAGYHDGSGKVTGDANLTAANIKSGSTVFGVTGTHTGIGGYVQNTSSGNATAAEIATGKKAWVDGVEVIGTLAVKPGPYCNCSGGTLYDEANGGTRWCDNGDGTVTDLLGDSTNYNLGKCSIWLQDANCKDELNGITNTTGRLAWLDSIRWSIGLKAGSCGLTDGSAEGEWRLPNRYELDAITNGTDAVLSDTPRAFSSVQNGAYWSSTGVSFDKALWMHLGRGSAGFVYKTYSYPVWSVRERRP